MAAAHLCEPACWAASSLAAEAGSPLRTRAIPDLPRLILYCLSFSPRYCTVVLFKRLGQIINWFNFHVPLGQGHRVRLFERDLIISADNIANAPMRIIHSAKMIRTPRV